MAHIQFSLKAATIEVTHEVDQLLPHEVAQLLPHHSASGTPHSFLDQWHTFIFWTNGTHSLSFYPPFLDQWHTFIVGPMAHIHFLDANGMATRRLYEPHLRLAVCLLCLVFLDGTHSLRFPSFHHTIAHDNDSVNARRHSGVVARQSTLCMACLPLNDIAKVNTPSAVR